MGHLKLPLDIQELWGSRGKLGMRKLLLGVGELNPKQVKHPGLFSLILIRVVPCTPDDLLVPITIIIPDLLQNLMPSLNRPGSGGEVLSNPGRVPGYLGLLDLHGLVFACFGWGAVFSGQITAVRASLCSGGPKN